MVTKGLDFDNVRVVGILSADNLLSFPDFRAHERSYQLMAQVSGRAGRKHQQGKVVIQTWQPHHEIISDVVRNDYLSMYEQQIVHRNKFRYPPFYRLIIIKMRHKDYRILNAAATIFGNQLRSVFGDDIYGPEYPMVARVRTYYVKEIMLKQPRTAGMNLAKEKILSNLNEFRKLAKYKSVRIQFDVDPQ
jgi:primosomal protein N' (replication factor Y)